MLVEKWGKENRTFRKQDVREITYFTTVVGNEKLFQIHTYGAKGSSVVAKQTIHVECRNNRNHLYFLSEIPIKSFYT
ncbi:hypothetical protein [Lysinibacillus xylanilyticus]|uniref:hypothetical protein n=1 Tax=Lysinibacillus xylanilyticus TaxID=582475 RepID=UPI003CFCE50D